METHGRHGRGDNREQMHTAISKSSTATLSLPCVSATVPTPVRSTACALVEGVEQVVPLRSFNPHILKRLAGDHAQVGLSGLSGWQRAN